MSKWDGAEIVIVDDQGPIGQDDKVRRQAWYFRVCRALGVEPELPPANGT